MYGVLSVCLVSWRALLLLLLLLLQCVAIVVTDSPMCWRSCEAGGVAVFSGRNRGCLGVCVCFLCNILVCLNCPFTSPTRHAHAGHGLRALRRVLPQEPLSGCREPGDSEREVSFRRRGRLLLMPRRLFPHVGLCRLSPIRCRVAA